mmetsp:Transcript_83757/g.232134  ORF Transcript_83757/g.232134 Transcript_83757/m.232134 type:complete len:86 (-) Transcript_83757:3192-3449(-)
MCKLGFKLQPLMDELRPPGNEGPLPLSLDSAQITEGSQAASRVAGFGHGSASGALEEETATEPLDGRHTSVLRREECESLESLSR